MLAATTVKMSGSEKETEQEHTEFHRVVVQNNGKEMNKKKACQVFFLLIGKNLACVAGV